jgi:hypothetical protein
VKIALVLILVVYPAVAQIQLGSIQHGSVGIVHLTKNEISMAADSRGVGGPAKISDVMCKVAAFGDDLIFVTTGTVTFLDSPGFKGWSNVEEARAVHREIASRYSGVKGHVQEVAEQWGRNISANFNRIGRSSAKEFRALVSKEGDFTVAMFGGQAATGELVLFSAQIIPESPSSLSSKSIVDQMVCPYDNFCAVGSSKILIEFTAAKSERSKTEKATWKPRRDYAPGSLEYTMFRTIRMVELTIKYRTGIEVGGPIDAVQFRRRDDAEHIRWYDRKPNCK